LAFVPWPAWVSAPAFVELAEGRMAYVQSSGKLLEIVRPGTVIEQGAPLARLANDDLERERIELAGELARQQQHVRLLESLRVSSTAAGLQLPAAQATLADLTERLAKRQAEIARLVVTAPISGTAFPPPPTVVQAIDDALPTWWGSPLDADNLGCWLEAGTPLCRLGTPGRLEAVLVVDQSQVESLREGLPVRVHLDGAWRPLDGQVVEVARADVDSLPRELLITGRVPTQPDPSGRLEPLGTQFRVRALLDTPTGQPPPLDSLGSGSIRVAPRSLVQRGHAWLRRTFGLGI
jgi:putative peptide zinc metalloprotease protein